MQSTSKSGQSAYGAVQEKIRHIDFKKIPQHTKNNATVAMKSMDKYGNTVHYQLIVICTGYWQLFKCQKKRQKCNTLCKVNAT